MNKDAREALLSGVESALRRLAKVDLNEGTTLRSVPFGDWVPDSQNQSLRWVKGELTLTMQGPREQSTDHILDAVEDSIRTCLEGDLPLSELREVVEAVSQELGNLTDDLIADGARDDHWSWTPEGLLPRRSSSMLATVDWRSRHDV